ncbi:hypothetical protein [Candidatus Odyssella thessalonicensis]|uniref:hypothetical protein n=1 Tax=Candidatus Odyssella thessalonicensis TaxID=84647 RepID=UPI000225C14B|nr:hypothetical protein [Candidatus Odyssella thessalonicensis]
MYGVLEETGGILTAKRVRLRYLYWIRIALETVCNAEFYPFFMLNQVRTLWMDHRLREAYLKCFSKPEDLALLKSFASKMGSPEWDPSQSSADKDRSGKAIERACYQMMLNSYYIPALAEKASQEESENLHQALASYLTLAKFSPRDLALNNYLFHLQKKATTMVGKQLFQQALISILPIYLQFARSNVSELRLRGFNRYLIWIQYRDDVSAIQQAEKIIEAALLEFPNEKTILGNAGRIYCFLLNNVKGFDLLQRLVKEEPSVGPFIALAEAYFYFGYKVTDASELEALKWYLRAADSGDPVAIKLLNDLKSLIRSSLSPQKEKEDQSEWIPQHLKQKPKARDKGKHRASKPSTQKTKNPENTNHNSFPEMLTIEEPSEELIQQFQLPLHDPAKEAVTEEEKLENDSSEDKASSKAELEETASPDESVPTWQLYNKSKTNNPKTMREILRRMAMLSYLQENANKTSEEFKLNLNNNQKLTLAKIFDLTKPTIMEKEFLQFANAACFHNKFRLFKTTSGFALTAINGLIAEQEERSAGTHWLHGSKKDGLDGNFVAKVRKVLDNLNIKPDLI